MNGAKISCNLSLHMRQKLVASDSEAPLRMKKLNVKASQEPKSRARLRRALESFRRDENQGSMKSRPTEGNRPLYSALT